MLTASEVETVLGVPDVKDSLGLRDRALLEVLYSTGVRRSELVKLHVFDVDVERGTILIREGKRSNDRVVPIGERALSWIEKYQREVRQQLLTDPNNTVLFVSKLGDGLTPGHLTMIVRRHVKAANIGKSGSCHLFRHAMATLMLEGGADVRMVQAMLGHASLDTTALYTHVAIRTLKEVHERTHPGARLGKPPACASKDGAAEVEAAELLAALEAEQAEEVERSGAVSAFDEEPAPE